MKHYFYKAGLPILGLIAFTGCTDDNYDLDNIDTTSVIKVKDLVIPVNLSEITLDQVLDVDEDDSIIVKWPEGASPDKQFYAIKKGGNFSADNISVDLVEAPQATGLNPINVDFGYVSVAPGNTPQWELADEMSPFEYDINNVDEAIKSVEYLGLVDNSKLHLTITFSSDLLSKYNWLVEDLIVSIPKGLNAEYGNENVNDKGELKVGTVTSDNQGNIKVNIEISSLDLKTFTGNENGIPIVDGFFNIDGEIGVKSASVKVAENNQTIEGDLSLNIEYAMSSFIVNEFSGEIDYTIESPSIAPVDLSDLPDFLTGEDTHIILDNPQIYLSVKNGVGDFGVGCNTGITITPYRDGMASETLTPDNGYFNIGKNSSNGYYNLVMAPKPEDASISYPELQGVPFTDLKNILKGNGMPETIEFTLDNPVVKGHTQNFKLGESFEFDGEYTFFTPIAFESGSSIVYTKKEHDWFDKDIDEMKIDILSIDAVASTKIPYEVTLEVYPLDKDGNRLQNAIPGKTTLPANATEIPFKLEIKNADGVDGVEFIATVKVENENELKPTQTIVLSDLRAKVSGSYTTEF